MVPHSGHCSKTFITFVLRGPYNSPITIGLGQSFPHGSVGKESVSSAGDPSSIPGLGRSAGEGIGYPLQYSWASLVAQLVKNPPAMRETWVRSLGLGRSPGDGKGYPLQYSGLENPMDPIVHGVAKSSTRLRDLPFHYQGKADAHHFRAPHPTQLPCGQSTWLGAGGHFQLTTRKRLRHSAWQPTRN